MDKLKWLDRRKSPAAPCVSTSEAIESSVRDARHGTALERMLVLLAHVIEHLPADAQRDIVAAQGGRYFELHPAGPDKKATPTSAAQADMADRHPAARGHQADGSSIQNHSCGSHYPYVVVAQETKFGLRWHVATPDGSLSRRFVSAEEALRLALDMALARGARPARETAEKAAPPRDELGRGGALASDARKYLGGLLGLVEEAAGANRPCDSAEMLAHLRALRKLMA